MEIPLNNIVNLNEFYLKSDKNGTYKLSKIKEDNINYSNTTLIYFYIRCINGTNTYYIMNQYSDNMNSTSTLFTQRIDNETAKLFHFSDNLPLTLLQNLDKINCLNFFRNKYNDYTLFDEDINNVKMKMKTSYVFIPEKTDVIFMDLTFECHDIVNITSNNPNRYYLYNKLPRINDLISKKLIKNFKDE